MPKTFRRKVQHGSKLGRKIGFPTLNFNVGRFGECHRHGVYKCAVFIGGKAYAGALHFGSAPHHAETLEIHVLNFSKNLYGQWVSFSVGKKIRNVRHFKNIDALKKQLQKDVSHL